MSATDSPPGPDETDKTGETVLVSNDEFLRTLFGSLSSDQLVDLTGCHRADKQIECLKRNRIPYTTNVRGKPVVTVAAVEGTGSKACRIEQPAYIPSILKIAA